MFFRLPLLATCLSAIYAAAAPLQPRAESFAINLQPGNTLSKLFLVHSPSFQPKSSTGEASFSFSVAESTAIAQTLTANVTEGNAFFPQVEVVAENTSTGLRLKYLLNSVTIASCQAENTEGEPMVAIVMDYAKLSIVQVPSATVDASTAAGAYVVTTATSTSS